MRILLWVAVGLIAVTGLIRSEAVAQSAVYALKPGDVVEITVLDDASLNRRALVRPDGMISMPLAGEVRAAGRTLIALQDDVATRLAASFVNPPNVTASLVAVAPARAPAAPKPPKVEEPPAPFSVYVLGEVRSPGRYEFNAEKPITVLQVLALAGGPATFAARTRIQIRRVEETGETTTLFDYDALETTAAAAPLQPLGDGDVIVVPERSLFD